MVKKRLQAQKATNNWYILVLIRTIVFHQSAAALPLFPVLLPLNSLIMRLACRVLMFDMVSILVVAR